MVCSVPEAVTVWRQEKLAELTAEAKKWQNESEAQAAELAYLPLLVLTMKQIAAEVVPAFLEQGSVSQVLCSFLWE